MTIYKLMDGKWGDWVKAWRADIQHRASFSLDLPPCSDVAIYTADDIVDYIKPDGETFSYSEEPVGAYCSPLLRYTLKFTLTPGEARALAALKIKIPKTDVQDDIFSALAKLKEALEIAESEPALRLRDKLGIGVFGPSPLVFEEKGGSGKYRRMADGTPHPLDVSSGEGDEKTLRRCVITDEYGAELVITNDEIVRKLLNEIHSYTYSEEAES